MCDHKEFILCSCDGENLPVDKIGWMLERKDANKMMQCIMGMPAMTFFSNQELSTKTAIVHLLNSKNCFDFEYQPQEDDFLEIRTGEGEYKWYAYRFVAGKWKEDNSVSFDAWRTMLSKYKNGKINFDVRTLAGPASTVTQESKDNLFAMQQEAMMAEMQKLIKNQPIDTPIKRLKEIKELYDMGILTEEEFTAQKKKILNSL